MPSPSKPQIKINALARLANEYEQYIAEEAALQQNLNTLEASRGDAYEIRRTQQVISETKRVMAHVAQSLKEHSVEVRKLGGLKPEEERQAKSALEAAARYTK